MIMKKPFALLIKNFRLIHFVLGIFICYIVYRTSAILNFLTEYISNPTILIDPKQTHALCSAIIYVLPLLLIMGYVIIMILMRFKKKPITFYFVSIIICLLTIIVYVFAGSTLKGLEISLIEVRTLKFDQDLIRTALILQFLCAIVTLVRATGFNIKKFGFTKDLEQLDIEATDNEEFEVNVEVDSNSFKTRIRRFKRYAKYVFAENKPIIIIASTITVFAISFIIYKSVFINNKIYKVGEYITTNDFVFKFDKAYKTIYDYREKESENEGYVVVNFYIRNLYTVKTPLETTRLTLLINDHTFYHDRGLSEKFFDLGSGYQNSKIGSENETHSLMFKIPKKFLNDPMYLIYNESGKKIKIKIEAVNLTISTNQKEYKIGEEIPLKGSVLGESTIKIASIEINDLFRSSYKFCVKADECYDAEEILAPSFTDNFDKVLLKLTGEVNLSKSVKVERIDKLGEFIKRFGTIVYQKENGKTEIVENIVTVTAQHGNAQNNNYIECNKEIANATHVWIEIRVRDKSYRYTVK